MRMIVGVLVLAVLWMLLTANVGARADEARFSVRAFPAWVDLGPVSPGSAVTVSVTVEGVGADATVELLGAVETWATVAPLVVERSPVGDVSTRTSDVVVLFDVPDGTPIGAIDGAVRIGPPATEAATVVVEVPIVGTITNSNRAPADLNIADFAVIARADEPGLVVSATLANTGEVDATTALVLDITDGDGQVRSFSLGRILAQAGTSAQVSDLVGGELPSGQYQAELYAPAFPTSAVAADLVISASSAQPGAVIEAEMRRDDASGRAVVHMVVEHPGTGSALVRVEGSIDGWIVLDESTVSTPGAGELTLVFPLAVPVEDGELELVTFWNSERIDARVLGNDEGGATRSAVVVGGGAALLVAASVARASRRRPLRSV